MSVLLDANTRLIVQGITGREGGNQARLSLEFGTKVVGGVTPGRGDTTVEGLGLPVFNTVAQAVRETGANVSIIFVPAAFATDAILEAVDAGLPLVVCITEGIPVHDMVKVRYYLRNRQSVLIGPNCPGIISPATRARAGIMPPDVFIPGRIGVLSRSGTLLYDAVAQLTEKGIGQSTALGIGGDPVPGMTFTEALDLFQADPETDALVLIGEIGGTAEQEAASHIKSGKFTKPVVAFIGGRTAPPGRRCAGAIISGGTGTWGEGNCTEDGAL
jgi:succinyl-CoA synthetase alpha subunit